MSDLTGSHSGAAGPAAVVVLTALPSGDAAAAIARAVVAEGLAACVSLVPQVRSIYPWQGAIHDETEALAIAKTTAERADALRARIVALHPYEVPEVLVLPAIAGHPPYLAWLAAAVAPPGPGGAAAPPPDSAAPPPPGGAAPPRDR